MTNPDPRKVPWVDLDPSKVTRREALSGSLKAGTSPEVPRTYSTLVRRSESLSAPLDDCAYCDALLRAAESHLTGHKALNDYPRSYEALIAAVLAFSSRSATAGGTDSSGDKVQNERRPDPHAAANGEEDQGDGDQED
jgi:hypothetical protein